jgi:DNA-binding transcriptional regulator PaaX
VKKYYKYKGVTINAFGLPILCSNKNEPEKPRRFQRRYSQYRNFYFNFANTALKNLMVIYDIPSGKRSERDWFRRQLKRFDYIMIQKSVWVGPSPLPQDFLNYVKSIGLLSKLKILKLAKPYSRESINK